MDGDYSEIGALLRVAREQMRLPIDQAARLLHIRMRYLDSLEQGRLHELPGLTYTRGYLQAYAAFLGLDKSEILRRFEGIEGGLSRKGIYFPQVFSKEKTPNRPIIWGGLAFAIVAYGLWAVVVKSPTAKISMVEKMTAVPDKKEKPTSPGNAACFQEQDAYYPPCTMVKEGEYALLPLHYRMTSIMDLAIK